MRTLSRVFLLIVLSGTAASAELPVCPVESDSECPPIDLHFTDEMLQACERFQSWHDCYIHEEEGLTAWFFCDIVAVLMRESCTDTCAWQTLSEVETCDELISFLSEVPCPL